MSIEAHIAQAIVKSNKKIFIRGYLSYQITNLFLIFSGLVLMNIFSKYENEYDKSIWITIILFITILLSRICGVFLTAITNASTRFASENLLREKIIEHRISRKGKSDETSIGSVVNSLTTDVNQFIEYIQKKYVELPSTIIFVLIALSVLWLIDYKLLLITFPPLVAIVLIIKKAGKWISKFNDKNRKTTGKVTEFIGDIFECIQVIKLHKKEDVIMDRFLELNETRKRHAIKDYVISDLLMALYRNVVMIGIGIALIAFSIIYDNESFSLSKFTIFVYYMGFISSSIEYFGSYFINHKKAEVSAKNIEKVNGKLDLLLLRNESTDNIFSYNTFMNLEISELSYSIGRLQVIHSGFNLVMKKGDIVVVSGRVGSGKTTLLKSLLGLTEETSMNIKWNGIIAENISNLVNNNKIAYSPQKPNFFDSTLKDNITLGRDISTDVLEEVLRITTLEQDIRDFPSGLEENIGNGGVKLSGGQKQRLALARMLVSDADLYLIDDISSALDTNTAENLLTNLMNLRNKSFIIVSNRVEYLKRADSIIVMKDGEITANDSLHNLRMSCNEFRRIWNT